MDSLRGELDNVPLFGFGMKEEDCVVIPMSTYGTNKRVGEEEFRMIDGDSITSKYPKTVHNHY